MKGMVADLNLQMNESVAGGYRSNSQKTRVITEKWVENNLFCPCCGNAHISHFENNRPVADFYCQNCLEEYELKSKKTPISSKIAGGAYDKMIERIKSSNNPNFFFMEYDKNDLKIKNLILIPKYFFVPDIVEKRKPLADTAKRAGWVGCNIVLKHVPVEGRIYIIKDGVEHSVDKILTNVKKINFMEQYKIDARGWMLDILNCVNMMGEEFRLNQIYQFVPALALKHPENQHIRDKIRQQLQVLRDKGIIEFHGRGHYKKC